MIQNINYGELIPNIDSILYQKNTNPFLYRKIFTKTQQDLKHLFGHPQCYQILEYYYGYLIGCKIEKYSNLKDKCNYYENIFKKTFRDDLYKFNSIFDEKTNYELDYYMLMIQLIAREMLILKKKMSIPARNILYVYDKLYATFNERQKSGLRVQEYQGPKVISERIDSEILQLALQTDEIYDDNRALFKEKQYEPDSISDSDYKMIYCINTSFYFNYLKEFGYSVNEANLPENSRFLGLDKHLLSITCGLSILRYWIDIQDTRIVLSNFNKLLESFELIDSIRNNVLLYSKMKLFVDSWTLNKIDIENQLYKIEKILEEYITELNSTLKEVTPIYMSYYRNKYSSFLNRGV